MRRMKEPEGADAMKPMRQDVQKEAAQEILAPESSSARAIHRVSARAGLRRIRGGWTIRSSTLDSGWKGLVRITDRQRRRTRPLLH